MSNSYYSIALKKFFFKKFLITSSINLKIFFFKNQKVVLLQNQKNRYFFICPLFLDIIYKGGYLYLIFQSKNFLIKKKILFFFLVHLRQSLKQLCKPTSLTFLIKGVGLKIALINSTLLNLKLGYSHLISLLVPSTIAVFIFKKKIILCGYNKISIGNLGSIIYSYRPINIFTGKGLLKKQKKKFKLKEYTKKI